MSNVTALKPRPAAAPAPVWLSPEQVCERVPGLTKVRLQDLRDRGLGPAYQKPTARTVIYRADDVDAWVLSTRVSTREQS
ncbi:hypothetical protein JNB63_01995 [Microbacterium trichothecenolyticum]|uniref:helix-turn-helix transcriptional regulator n=1 Tax=Microbacterium trichothecenolyticum TaxID=69370 RepID=UPI001C6E554D|nr:hypothetical protein [Microbacterium trichothecenolyticum]MBW9118857.1 hypothetical protein [Microbacterium trichothecenolyticum]